MGTKRIFPKNRKKLGDSLFSYFVKEARRLKGKKRETT